MVSKKYTFSVGFKSSVKANYENSLFYHDRSISDFPLILKNFIETLAEAMNYEDLYIKITRTKKEVKEIN